MTIDEAIKAMQNIDLVLSVTDSEHEAARMAISALRAQQERENPQPSTNAAHIRAMSDEELADIFLRADFCKCCEHEKDGVCNYICAYPNIPLYEGCKQAALKWMKQPAEEAR